MITVRQVPFDDPDAGALWATQQAELVERYGEPDLEPHLTDDGLISSLVAADATGTVVATVLLRWSPYDTPAGSAEIKRLYVLPEHRGHGHSRVLMGALEAAARKAGVTQMVLETGTEQPEALALYEGIGYRVSPKFGVYKDEANSICMAKDLPTRVLVINGTVGAGKTTTAAAVGDLLRERGSRHGYIDGDALTQAVPADSGDPYNQRLLFANLAAIAPNYRQAGYGLIIIPMVVEDAADRDVYARAFAGPGGPADISIVRVTASEEARLARLSEREPEGYWRDWCHARTVELEEVLESAGVDDAVVTNEDRDRLDTAAEVLDVAGW